MTKISPWYVLLAALVGWGYYTGSGTLDPRPWFESIAFPAYVVILVVLDHLVIPHLVWPEQKTASVRAVITVVLTALLLWAVRPSGTVTGIVVFVTLRNAWHALSADRQ